MPMTVPGFTADVTLVGGRARYRLGDLASPSTYAGSLQPALGLRFAPLPSSRMIGRTLGFTCQGAKCSCSGDPDCNDLFSSGLCGDIAACYEQPGGGVKCECLRI
jgi:hypothetical protein